MCESRAQWGTVRSMDASIGVNIFIVFQAMGLMRSPRGRV